MENTTVLAAPTVLAGPTAPTAPTGPTEYKREPFKIMTYEEFDSITPDNITWLCETLISEGCFFLLAAYPKTGKSQFISQLAIAVAQGKDFLGFKTMQRGVLILALEEGRALINIRLIKLGILKTDPVYLRCDPVRNSADHIEDLKQHIKEHNIGLVIIDTIGHWWNVENENVNTHVLRELEPLMALAHDTRCAIGIIHHEKKGGGGHFKNVRGASAISGAVDQQLSLEYGKGKHTTKRILRTEGRYKDVCPPELMLDFKDGKYVSLGTKEAVKGNSIQANILEIISGSPTSLSEIEIRTRLKDMGTKASRTLNEKHLGILIEENKITCSGEGTRGNPYRYPMNQVEEPELEPALSGS